MDDTLTCQLEPRPPPILYSVHMYIPPTLTLTLLLTNKQAHLSLLHTVVPLSHTTYLFPVCTGLYEVGIFDPLKIPVNPPPYKSSFIFGKLV